MLSVISKTIESNYPELLDGHRQICNIDWNRMFKVESLVDKKKKRRKKAESKVQIKNRKLTDDEKLFFSVQKSLVLLGSYINGCDVSMDNIRIDPKNYDELITNINWVDRESGEQLLLDLSMLCERVFPDLCVDGTEWTVRKNTVRLFYEMFLETLGGRHIDFELVRSISESIECSVLLYAVLMGSEVCKGDLSSIVWSDNLIKIVYFTKANAILCSLTNPKYNDSLISGLLDCSIHPLDLAFMKRSQLLSARFEDMEENKLKIYEESGITVGDEDYTRFENFLLRQLCVFQSHVNVRCRYHSTVRCHKCKLFHTSYSQLQTRSADEPMTIFYYCHKCRIRGRQ